MHLTRRTFLLGAVAAQSPGLGAGRDPFIEHIEVFRAGEGGYYSMRIPAIVTTRKGTLLAFCEARKHSRSDTGDIDVVLKRSADHGRTWSDLRVVADFGGDTVGNPCPVVERRTGVIWLPLTSNPGHMQRPEINATPRSRRMWIAHSKDDGLTWARPAEITASVTAPDWTWSAAGPGNSIQLRSGRLLVPADYIPLGSTEERSYVFYSDDRGRSWKRGGELPPATGEAQAVELDSGSVVLNMRSFSGGRRLTALSKDGGLTWSGFRADEELIEPRCQASILRYTTLRDAGRSRILFSNPADRDRRVRMTVRLSYDGAASWPIARVLHEGPAAYSSLAVMSDGTIGCLYERGEQNAYETITFSRFNLAWLSAGADSV